jgi:hypothetical protein
VKRSVILSLLVSLATPILPASAAYGLTNLVISNENPKSNDIFTVEFEVSRPIGIDQKYQIVIGFSSSRDSFSGVADLYEGNYSQGKWRAKITVPGDIYSGDFTLTFTPKGSQENNKDQISAGSKRIGLKITGIPVPIPPLIEVSNIKADKQVYSGGSIIRITFDTKILGGTPNVETENPQVKLWDLRFNSYLRPTTNRGKPITAIGNYTVGKWSVDYPIEPLTLNTTAQIYVDTPRGYDNPSLVTKGEIVQIQGLVNEIKISNVRLDQKQYEPNSKVRVTFSTSSIDTILNSSNKPFIILTDLELSDLSSNIETTLVSGTINSGEWMAEFTAPELNLFNPPKNSYLLGFYNSARTIRDIGAELVIRKNQKLTLAQPKSLIFESKSTLVDFQVSTLSSIPIENRVLTPNNCSINESKVTFLAEGKCEILSLAAGNEEWAESSFITTLIKSVPKSTIICLKGKTTKKVTAVNPKCPVGYRKK